MPSSSKRQAALFRAVAHSPEFAAKVDIPQSVGRDFMQADMMEKPKAPAVKKISDALKRYGYG